MENSAPQISTPIERVGSEVWKRFKRSKFIPVFFVVLALGFAALLIDPPTGMAAVSFTFMFSAPVFLGILVYQRFKVMREFMEQFAVANGYEFRALGSAEDRNQFMGALFDHRSGSVLTNLITGIYKEHPLSIFNYRYLKRSADGKRVETIAHTVFELRINTNLPNIFLLTKWFFGGFNVRSSESTLKFTSEPKEVPIGRDYDRTFKLYAPEDYEVEALQIFTYSVMEELRKAYKEIGSFSLELIEDRLYVYIRGEITSALKLRAVYAMCGTLLSELSPTVKRMNRMLNAQEEALTRLNQSN